MTQVGPLRFLFDHARWGKRGRVGGETFSFSSGQCDVCL